MTESWAQCKNFPKMVSSTFMSMFKQSLEDYLQAWSWNEWKRKKWPYHFPPNHSAPLFIVRLLHWKTYLYFSSQETEDFFFTLTVIDLHLQNRKSLLCSSDSSCLSRVDFIYWALDMVTVLFFLFSFFLTLLGFELSVYHLSHSTLHQPFLCWIFFEIGSCELFALTGFKPWSS
jgi:hypothetical protein